MTAVVDVSARSERAADRGAHPMLEAYPASTRDAGPSAADGPADADRSPSTGVESDMVRLGRAIRSARGDRLSQEALAQRSGVSTGLLSQIERGIGNPSLQTLLRVSRALDLTMAELIGGRVRPPEPKYVVRASERRRQVLPAKGLTVDVLTPPEQRAMSICRVRVQGRRRIRPADSTIRNAAGTTCVIATSGTLTLNVDGALYRLAEGDTLTCATDSIAELSNDSDAPCEYLAIATPASL